MTYHHLLRFFAEFVLPFLGHDDNGVLIRDNVVDFRIRVGGEEGQ